MIRRENGEMVVECDECGEEFYGGVEDNFSKFIEAIKNEEWRISKDEDDEWIHHCPDCIG